MNTTELEKKWREELRDLLSDNMKRRGWSNFDEFTIEQMEYHADFTLEQIYLSACKKRQEEIDIENSIIKEYREQCILNAEELTTLRADKELRQCFSCGELAMGKGGIAMLNINKAQELEIQRLKDLVTRAKLWVKCAKEDLEGWDTDAEEQWLADFKKEIGG